jgi:hypothetical protein
MRTRCDRYVPTQEPHHTDLHRLAELSWAESLDIGRIHTPDTMSSSRNELKLKAPQTCEWLRRTTYPTLAWPFPGMLTQPTPRNAAVAK